MSKPMSPLEFAERLMAYTVVVGGSVNSWGRTKVRNMNVGGLVNSHHLTWTGGDVGYDPPGPLYDVVERRKIAARYGLELTDETDHDHLEPL